MKGEGYKRLILNVLILALYILAMKFVGYMISTPIVLYILASWYAKGYSSTVKGRLIFAIATTAVIYAAYNLAFGYSLPVGILFE